MKNTKGFIALFSALAALVCLVVGVCIPLTKIIDTPFWGYPNLILGIVALVLCLIAIVFAILSFKDKDKKGPRKAGLFLGIFFLLFTWIPMVIGWFGGAIDAYTKGNNDNFVATAMNDYNNNKKDNYLQNVLDSINDENAKKDLINYLDKFTAEHEKNAK